MSRASTLREAARRLSTGCCSVTVENCGGGVDPFDVQRIARDWLEAHPPAPGEADVPDEAAADEAATDALGCGLLLAVAAFALLTVVTVSYFLVG